MSKVEEFDINSEGQALPKQINNMKGRIHQYQGVIGTSKCSMVQDIRLHKL
jgi:hypothetical protein